ncbi:MAG: hypothetical protein ACK5B6_06815 [Bacteroidia bacterium]
MLVVKTRAKIMKIRPRSMHKGEFYACSYLAGVKLILLDKIERAEKESERGETITEAELEKEIEKWFN